jgi:hypothetical protein
MTLRKTLIVLGLVAAATLPVAACGTDDADVVSENLSTAADNFEIVRRVVFFNGITDEILLEVVGRCSIDDDGNQLELTCKTGPDEYYKHFLGLSDNVSYFAEQVEGADVSEDFYRVTFKPSVIVPDIDIDPVPEGPESQED